MRTTIDLPDDLFRAAKSEAALRGMKFKEYATALFRQGLPHDAESPHPKGQHRPIPVNVPPAGRKFTVRTNAELFEIIDREEDEAKGRLAE